jgi:hypothetical protein
MDYFSTFAAHNALPLESADELTERGFTVLPGPIAIKELAALQSAYDIACMNAAPEDVGVGRASTRVNDFVNRGAEFDRIYTWLAALDAARRVIEKPFRLSAMHARTLRPGASPQELHVDVPRSSDAWPMLGMIFMVDDFRADNGATRFVPGSHRWTELPENVIVDRFAQYPGEVIASGAAGSVILFNASTWHGHTANVSNSARRSLQATFIPRDGNAATNFEARMSPETRTRTGEVGRYLVGRDTSRET